MLKLKDTDVPWIKAIQPPPIVVADLTSDNEFFIKSGLPSRPGDSAPAGSLDIWKDILSAEPVVPPVFTTGIFHGPIQDFKVTSHSSKNALSATSSNWSGFVLTNSKNEFATKDTAISARFTVPKPVPATGFAIPDYTSIWIGIDGLGSPDVLQCGIQINNDGSNGSPTPYFWLEWFPYPEAGIGLPVSWGDEVALLLIHDRGVGVISILNSTTGQSAFFRITPPPGTVLIGNCAEWIIERPNVNGALANLCPYFGTVMPSCSVEMGVGANPLPNGRPAFYGPSNVNNGEIYNLQMLSNAGKVISASAVLFPASDPDDPQHSTPASIGFQSAFI